MLKPIRSRSRPERHFVDSFITIRLALARAIARWLPRCPLCHRENAAREDLSPKPIKLPPRQKGKHYKRPPETDQHFIPEKY